MITHQQYRRLMNEYQKTQNIGRSALKVNVDRHTARKYLGAGRSPAELKTPHTWRTRPDPLESVWAEAQSMLQAAPELEARALLSISWVGPGAICRNGICALSNAGCGTGGPPTARRRRCSSRRNGNRGS